MNLSKRHLRLQLHLHHPRQLPHLLPQFLLREPPLLLPRILPMAIHVLEVIPRPLGLVGIPTAHAVANPMQRLAAMGAHVALMLDVERVALALVAEALCVEGASAPLNLAVFHLWFLCFPF